ncbi:MAG: hypothetical protein WDN44_15050 [Sphingomonas sp.]
MGLTGVILRAAFRMIRVETSRIRQLTIRAPDLDAALGLFEASMDWTYSVAWIDCLAAGNTLGRSVVFLGEHARAEDLPPAARADPLALPPARRVRVPVDFPAFALGPLSVRAFNMVYYAAQRPGHALVGLEPYFYPLDAIGDWNRIYGRRGFVQYQCVLPLEASREGLTRLLAEIAAANNGSFLAVLKRMGAQSHGLLSFPMPGYTLALDFPVKPATLALLDRLDAITGEHGGRVYLAKDARARATGVQAAIPGLPNSGRCVRAGSSIPPFRPSNRNVWGFDVEPSLTRADPRRPIGHRSRVGACLCRGGVRRDPGGAPLGRACGRPGRSRDALSDQGHARRVRRARFRTRSVLRCAGPASPGRW